jgi:hypothetical protein
MGFHAELLHIGVYLSIPIMPIIEHSKAVLLSRSKVLYWLQPCSASCPAGPTRGYQQFVVDVNEELLKPVIGRYARSKGNRFTKRVFMTVGLILGITAILNFKI